jgi:hypothetical protein
MSAKIEDVFASYKEAKGFFFKNPAQLSLDFAKISMMEIAIQLLSMLAVAGFGLIGGAAIAEEAGQLSVVSIVFGLIVLLVFGVLTSAVSATCYSIVEERRNGRRCGILRKAVSLIVPMGRYTILAAAIFVGLVALISLGGLALAAVNPLAAVVPLALGFVLFITVLFGIQFSIIEIVLKGAGPMEGMKRSWALAKANAIPVLLFDAVLMIAVLVSVVVFMVLSAPVAMLESITGIGSVLGSVYSFVIMIAQSTVTSLLSVLSIYFFYLKLTGASGGDAEVPKTALAAQAPKPGPKKRSKR